MFSSCKTELARRSTQVGQVWRLVDGLEAKEVTSHAVEPALRTLKGSLFVHYYSVYEYTVTSSFAAALRQFNSYSLRYADVKRSILALALDAGFTSIASLSDRRSWSAKMDLLSRANSGDAVSVRDTLFPRDDTQYRHAQLNIICDILGMPSEALTPNPRFIGFLDEIVDNRNRIAHGRESADAVGGRYSSADLDTRRSQMDLLCNHIVATMEAHTNVAANFH